MSGGYKSRRVRKKKTFKKQPQRKSRTYKKRRI
jgi:hypothetical protein